MQQKARAGEDNTHHPQADSEHPGRLCVLESRGDGSDHQPNFQKYCSLKIEPVGAFSFDCDFGFEFVRFIFDFSFAHLCSVPLHWHILSRNLAEAAASEVWLDGSLIGKDFILVATDILWL